MNAINQGVNSPETVARSHPPLNPVESIRRGLRRSVLFLAADVPVKCWLTFGRPRGWLNAWASLAAPLIRWGSGR